MNTAFSQNRGGRTRIIGASIAVLLPAVAAFIILSVTSNVLAIDANIAPESTAKTESNKNARLRVNGTRLVDGNGNEVRLRGIYSREEWLSSEQEAQWFKDWGVNFVRFLLAFDPNYWQVVNDGQVDLNKRCILRDENIQKTKAKCQWFEKRKIYFIMEVPWRWYGIDEKFEKPELLAQQCARMYKELAENFREFDYLIGFCTFSEAYVAPQYYGDYKKIVTAIVDSVHETDPSRIVSATGVRTSGPDTLVLENVIDRPNVIYDFHYYDIKSFVAYRPYFGDMRYPGRIPHGFSCRSYYLDKKLQETYIAPALSFSARYEAPVWCGEFGAFNDAPDGSSDRWMRDVCRILETNHVPWIIWTWKKDMKDVPQVWKDLWQGKLDYNEVAISPHGGRFTDKLSVGVDAWVRDGEIRYTLDGTEPNELSELYKGPFKVDKPTTVKARLVRKGAKHGPVDMAVFEFGGLKPLELSEEKSAGLQYTMYDMAAEKIEDLKYKEEKKTGVCRDFRDIQLKESEDKTVIYEGLIDIPKSGRYFFYPISYGAYEIYVDNTMVNRHYATKLDYGRTSVGIIVIERGLHKFKILYSKPRGFKDGFELRLQRDAEPIDPPRKVEGVMFSYVKSS